MIPEGEVPKEIKVIESVSVAIFLFHAVFTVKDVSRQNYFIILYHSFSRATYFITNIVSFFGKSHLKSPKMPLVTGAVN